MRQKSNTGYRLIKKIALFTSCCITGLYTFCLQCKPRVIILGGVLSDVLGLRPQNKGESTYEPVIPIPLKASVT